MKKKILFHVCCGPCATASVQKLQVDDYEVTGFYCNPNIYPKSEYKKRLGEAKKFAALNDLQFVVPLYSPGEYEEAVAGVETKAEERCKRCWELRLRKTAQVAKELGFENFGTSLRISPYQNQSELLKLSQRIAKENGLEFYDVSLVPLYPDSIKLSKELGMYRQKYCGCRYSLEEVQKKPAK